MLSDFDSVAGCASWTATTSFSPRERRDEAASAIVSDDVEKASGGPWACCRWQVTGWVIVWAGRTHKTTCQLRKITGRRHARPQALARKYENHPNVFHVDAASTARSTVFVTSVVDSHGT